MPVGTYRSVVDDDDMVIDDARDRARLPVCLYFDRSGGVGAGLMAEGARVLSGGFDGDGRSGERSSHEQRTRSMHLTAAACTTKHRRRRTT